MPGISIVSRVSPRRGIADEFRGVANHEEAAQAFAAGRHDLRVRGGSAGLSS